MHTPFPLPWLQPGYTVPVEDTDPGVEGSEAVHDCTDQGGSARSSAANSSLCSWLSKQWKVQRVAPMSTALSFDTKMGADVVFGVQAWLYCLLCPVYVRNRNVGIKLSDAVLNF